MLHRPRMIAVVALAALVCTLPSFGQDWPCWRGPNHDGISAEKGFTTKWESPPPKLWTRDIGAAFSGLACVGDKVFTCGTANKQQVLFCLNADTGEVVWQTPIEKEYPEKSGGDGTRATPTVDEGRVYVVGALGKLLCCDAQTGKEIWSQQFSAVPQWGYSGSVLIEGNLAIVPAGGDRAPLLALDKLTGKQVWECGQGAPGYSTPYPFTLDGHRFIICMNAKEAVIADAQTGKQAWSTPWVTDWDVNAVTPVFHDGLLFLSSGYKTGSAVFKLTNAADKLTGERVWPPASEKENASKIILGKFQSAVLHEGHLYVSDEKALKCVDFATGKEKWSQRGISNGTVILADGNLVVFTEDGELQIAKLSPEKYEPTTKVELLTGRCWTIPTLYKGRIYVRNLKQVACYKLAP